MTLTGKRRGCAVFLGQWIGLFSLAFLYPSIVLLTQHAFVYDDPFILVRYGEHLADGAGWNFNVISPTNNAVTSPLYVLLIAGSELVGISPVASSLAIYTTAWGAGAVILARILFRDGRQSAGWLACALYSADPLLANVRGMETSLYLLLIIASIWAMQRRRWVALGILLGLLAMCRSDGIVVGAVVVGWLFVWRDCSRPRLLVVIAECIGIIGAWTASLWFLTGSAFPSTLAAKMAQRDSGRWGVIFDLGYLHDANAEGISGWEAQPANLLTLLGTFLVFAATAATVVSFQRRELVLPMSTVIAVVVVVEYGIVLRLPASYVWHYGPWTLWIVIGTSVILDELLQRRKRAMAASILVTVLIGFILAVAVRPDAIVRDQYRNAAEWIYRNSGKQHPTVAAMEIGEIGYYGKFEVVDYMGLLNSDAIPSIRQNDYSWWLSTKPDYWVTAKNPIDIRAAALPEFQHNYHAVASFGSLTVYRRN